MITYLVRARSISAIKGGAPIDIRPLTIHRTIGTRSSYPSARQHIVAYRDDVHAYYIHVLYVHVYTFSLVCRLSAFIQLFPDDYLAAALQWNRVHEIAKEKHDRSGRLGEYAASHAPLNPRLDFTDAT